MRAGRGAAPCTVIFAYWWLGPFEAQAKSCRGRLPCLPAMQVKTTFGGQAQRLAPTNGCLEAVAYHRLAIASTTLSVLTQQPARTYQCLVDVMVLEPAVMPRVMHLQDTFTCKFGHKELILLQILTTKRCFLPCLCAEFKQRF